MIHIDKFIPGGQALGTAPDGRKVFFWNALPGEDVAAYDVTKQKSHYLEAVATEIAHPAPERVEPTDPCFLATSPWQILDWQYENQQKSALVAEIFREHHIDIAPPVVHTDDRPYRYRNKMEYAHYWDKDAEQIELAFHARGSHRKFPIKQSSLEQPAIFAAAQGIVQKLNAEHAEARRFQSILLRADQNGHISGGLYENHQPHPDFPPLSDTILGYQYSYSPNGFFQINLPVYELALAEIARHVATHQVLDLYAGVGTIGLSVARDRQLTLVECNSFAFRELQANLPADAANIKAELAKSEEALDYITPDTTVILDPPRAGCAPQLLARLVDVRPPRVIYLSCNPATQARDLETLLPLYRLDTVQTFNFFPRTPHIENLVVLSLK